MKRVPAHFYRTISGSEPVRDWLHNLAEEQADTEAGLGACQGQNEGGESMSSSRIGSSFESFLEETGIGREVDDIAQKRALAWQISEAMKASGIRKVHLAEMMGTSRAQVDRLLDPANNRVQLDTLQRAARAVGRKLKVELV